MGVTSSYSCDLPGCTTQPCNDSDILADGTGARQRVILDGEIHYLDTNVTPNVVNTVAISHKVFCSLAHAVQWAQGVTV